MKGDAVLLGGSDAWHYEPGDWTFAFTGKPRRQLMIVTHVDRVCGYVQLRHPTRWERLLWVLAFPGRWVRRRLGR